ncbi:MAG: DUF3237 family protein, partial [Stellaceae bacterium]
MRSARRVVARADSEYYFRCAPVFETPPGPHDWLTRHVFVGYGARFE